MKIATNFNKDNSKAEYDSNTIIFKPYGIRTLEEYGLICKKCILHETDIEKLSAGCGQQNKCLREFHNNVQGYYINE